MKDDIAQTVRTLIVKEFLPSENPGDLTQDLLPITGCILDSIATLRLVMFLEERYRISFKTHEVDKEHLDTVGRVAQLVESRTS
jgi:acyl carrier protein